MNSAQQILNNFDWSIGSQDLIIVLIILASVLLHIFLFKKDKIFAVLFSIYSSYLVVSFFPFNIWLNNLSTDIQQKIILYAYLILILILIIAFSRAHIFARISKGLFGAIFKAILFGILNIGLALSFLTLILPINYLNSYSGTVLNLFASDVAHFVWVALPLFCILFFIKIKKRGPGRPPG